MFILVCILICMSMNSAQAMDAHDLVTYSQNSNGREHWQALFDRAALKRGSRLTDVKTLIKTVPRIFKGNEPSVPQEWIEKDLPMAESSDCMLTWIGHATFLLQAQGICGLIDPFWGDYTWGIFTLYKRLVPAALKKEEVPPLTFIALSHNHVDHCDLEALRFFQHRDNPIALVPEGDQACFEQLGFQAVVPCRWGDSVELKKGAGKIDCTFLPAAHDGDNGAWWGSWLFTTEEHAIYHGGDTGDAAHFQEIAKQHKIDVALLPIAPYTMRELQQPAHIDQQEAVDAFQRLGARLFIPMHCCTLPYCNDVPEECITRLQEEWRKAAHQVQDKQLLMLKFGKQYILKNLLAKN